MSSGPAPPHAPALGALTRIVWSWVRRYIHTQVLEAGYTDLNPAHVAIFRYPTADGLRPSDLADDMQITKQSVNELLGYLESRGYLVRDPDPTDSRSRRIRLTEEGHRLEQLVWNAAADAERSAAELLGRRRFDQFRASLTELVDRIAQLD